MTSDRVQQIEQTTDSNSTKASANLFDEVYADMRAAGMRSSDTKSTDAKSTDGKSTDEKSTDTNSTTTAPQPEAGGEGGRMPAVGPERELRRDDQKVEAQQVTMEETNQPAFSQHKDIRPDSAKTPVVPAEIEKTDAPQEKLKSVHELEKAGRKPVAPPPKYDVPLASGTQWLPGLEIMDLGLPESKL